MMKRDQLLLLIPPNNPPQNLRQHAKSPFFAKMDKTTISAHSWQEPGAAGFNNAGCAPWRSQHSSVFLCGVQRASPPVSHLGHAVNRSPRRGSARLASHALLSGCAVFYCCNLQSDSLTHQAKGAVQTHRSVSRTAGALAVRTRPGGNEAIAMNMCYVYALRSASVWWFRGKITQ